MTYLGDWKQDLADFEASGKNILSESTLKLVSETEPLDKDLGSKVWSKKVRKKAKELSGNIETGYMELARILYWVCDTKSTEPPYEPIYKEWGHSSFDNYAQEELNLHPRKAKYLRRIWFRLEVELAGLNQDVKKEILSLGWTKVRELVRVLTMQNATEWVDRAKSENYATLCVSIQKYLYSLENAQQEATLQGTPQSPVDPGLPPREKYIHKHLAFGESQAPVIEAALQKASILGASTSDNHLFTLICTDFLASNNIGSGTEARLRYISKLEEALGLRFIVTDPDNNNEVIYGFKTLEQIASTPEE